MSIAIVEGYDDHEVIVEPIDGIVNYSSTAANAKTLIITEPGET